MRYERGRFRSEKVIIRHTGDLYIVFWDEETIYLTTNILADTVTVVHRWFAPRETYSKSWRPFRKKLRERKDLTIIQALELAAAYGLTIASTKKKLNFTGKEVEWVRN